MRMTNGFSPRSSTADSGSTGALRTSLADDLRDYLRGGDRKVDLWQARVGGVEVGFDDAAQGFLNINTPEDLSAAEQGVNSQQ